MSAGLGIYNLVHLRRLEKKIDGIGSRPANPACEEGKRSPGTGAATVALTTSATLTQPAKVQRPTPLALPKTSKASQSASSPLMKKALENPEGMLKGVKVFREAPEGFLKRILPYLKPVFFGAGEDIVTEGEYGEDMYFIVDGDATCYRKGRTFGFTAGDFFGEVALLRGSLRSATVKATTDCHLMSLSREGFLQGVSEYPEVKDELEKTVMFRFEVVKYPSEKTADPAFKEKIMAVVEQQFRRMKEMSKRKVRFTLNERIGSGAYGSVFSSFNLVTGQPLAVKVIYLSTDKSKAQTLEVEQESQLMQRLRHPNLIQGYGMQTDEEDPGKLYILMELAPLGSLSKVLKQCGSLSEPAARAYARQALQGLQYLHRNDVVHRDIKPSNMLLAADGTVKLADFGISAAMGQGALSTMAVAGTPVYMSPEAINGKFGVASDIWALGCSILELVTGKAPWHHKHFENSTQLLFHIVTCGSGPEIPKTFRFASDDENGNCTSATFMPQTTDDMDSSVDFDGIRISPQLLSLLMQMLAIDPQERRDVGSFLAHDRFVADESEILHPDNERNLALSCSERNSEFSGQSTRGTHVTAPHDMGTWTASGTDAQHAPVALDGLQVASSFYQENDSTMTAEL